MANRDLLTKDGYMRRFWEIASENAARRDMMSDALRRLEGELRDTHGVRRYTSYKSFSAAKSRGNYGLRVRRV